MAVTGETLFRFATQSRLHPLITTSPEIIHGQTRQRQRKQLRRHSCHQGCVNKDSWTNQNGDNNLGAHPLSETPATADPELNHIRSRSHPRRVPSSSTL